MHEGGNHNKPKRTAHAWTLEHAVNLKIGKETNVDTG